MNNQDILLPSTIYAAAVAALPASDIDHHASDLYLKVTAESRGLLNRFKYKHLVETFVSGIDGKLWYDLPFCYDPTMTTTEA